MRHTTPIRTTRTKPPRTRRVSSLRSSKATKNEKKAIGAILDRLDKVVTDR